MRKGNCPMPEFKTPTKPESMEDKDKLELKYMKRDKDKKINQIRLCNHHLKTGTKWVGILKQ